MEGYLNAFTEILILILKTPVTGREIVNRIVAFLSEKFKLVHLEAKQNFLSRYQNKRCITYRANLGTILPQRPLHMEIRFSLTTSVILKATV